MKVYADRLPTALFQLATDALVVLWVYVWVRAALRLHDLVLRLSAPGAKVQAAGADLAAGLADAGARVGRVPVVGDELTAPFSRAATAAQALADAGANQQQTVGRLAVLLAVALLSAPLGAVLVGWLPPRLRWIRHASTAVAVREHPAGRDLLALRALSTRSLRELTQLGPDVAQAWRAGDPTAVDALAALELSRLGLRSHR